MWTSSSNRLDRHIKSGHGYYGIIPKDTQTRKRQGEGGLNGCKSILQGVKKQCNQLIYLDKFTICYLCERNSSIKLVTLVLKHFSYDNSLVPSLGGHPKPFI